MANYLRFSGNHELKNLILGFTLVLIFISGGFAQDYTYSDSWGDEGYTLESQSKGAVDINYSITRFSLNDVVVNGEQMVTVGIPGQFLGNDEGAPNLPGSGRYIAIPEGAKASVRIVSMRTKTFENVNVAPSPRIPWETEDGPLEYSKDESIYSKDQMYPAEPIKISDPDMIRGIDVVMLGITPFQYNPVTKELIVYRDLKVEVSFTGGSGHIGEDRLRSRWWDPMLSDMLLNYASLPKINYNKSFQAGDDVGCEYLIISPTNPEFLQWADSIRKFRTEQGIQTMVVTVADIGGNNANTIENYINNAYNTWDVVPAAILLFGDYGTNPANSVIAPIYNNYCVSDNIYSDVNGNQMPDIITARMTANNATELQTMVTKFINYERNPPDDPGFYDHPMTCLGFQSDRWFQICTESVAGYWENGLGKTTTRENAINSGTPGSQWSTTSYGNTTAVVNYFGPNGLGYIPATPGQINCTWNATGNSVANTINNGAFMLLHRDHGAETLWGEPGFSNTNVDNLTNNELTYVWSVNCLTGKYNYSGECLVEKLHRHTYGGSNAGALGAIGDSEISYSFVNDTYVWGCFDYMWPDFMPDYGTVPEERGILPSFANAAGKYFLQASNWPYNTNNKEVTYNLFHHHGDGFLMVYSDMPQNLTVVHNPVLLAGVTSFDVTANQGALIALTVNGEIIGTGTGTGAPLTIDIPGQTPPDNVLITVTKQNYYRYSSLVEVVPPTGPYVVSQSVSLNDATGGNGDGMMDYGESGMLSLTIENVGIMQADNVVVTLSSTDEYITITDGTENYGSVAAGSTAVVNDGFAFDVANDIPDGHQATFDVSATDGTDTWNSSFTIEGHAPMLEYMSFEIDDSAGNNNGKLDQGETADLTVMIHNNGSSEAYNVAGSLAESDPYLTVNSGSVDFGDMAGGEGSSAAFNVTAAGNTPAGHLADLTIDLTADMEIEASGDFQVVIGQIPVLILDLDENQNSSTGMEASLADIDVAYEKLSSFPTDLSIYTTIFVCLGTYPDNHVLTSSEGQDLADFLNNGGGIYMEGGDTWYFDDATAVHPMFHINGIVDGSGNLGVINGQTGTFTEGMSFNYSGDNNWMDHIEPISPAVKIFQNQTPAYGTGVAYDGGNYKTIGASHEFGGLTDGTSPSTKADLMQQYLDFLGIEQTLQALFNSDETQVCEGETVNFYDQSSGTVISWDWTFEGGSPATSTFQNPTVAYFNTGTYDVTLEISDGTETASITLENYVTVIAEPGQAATPTGDDAVCTNMVTSSDYATDGTPEADSYVWELTPSDAGTINGNGLTATVIWTPEWEGMAAVKVKGVNDCGEGEFSGEFDVDCSICTGIVENNSPEGAVIYPNPNNGIFTVRFTQNIGQTSINVVNLLNEVVYSNQTSTSSDTMVDIDLSDLSEGIYFVRIKNQQGEAIKKIVIR